MPFEIGHQYSVRAKLFIGALTRAIKQEDGARLRQAAERLLDKAAAGEPWAIMMLADRLDGKATQQVESKVEVAAVQIDEIEQTRLVHLALKLGLARLQASESTTIEPNAAAE